MQILSTLEEEEKKKLIVTAMLSFHLITKWCCITCYSKWY